MFDATSCFRHFFSPIIFPYSVGSTNLVQCQCIIQTQNLNRLVVSPLYPLYIIILHFFLLVMKFKKQKQLIGTYERYILMILWMGEILHQFGNYIYSLSYYDAIIYGVSYFPIVTNFCRISSIPMISPF